MAWLSSNTLSPTDSLHADQLNSLANDMQRWGGNVNGGGHHLANVIIDGYDPGGPGNYLSSPVQVIPVLSNNANSVISYQMDVGTGSYPTRWVVGKNATTESGGNAGSDFEINRYSDAGALLLDANNHPPISIRRSDGLIIMGAQQWNGPINGNGQTISNITITGVMQDPTTTKGDLIVHGGSGTTRLPGSATDGFVLTYDSTIPLGVKWAAAGAAQTPWAQNVNAAGFNLFSVGNLGVNTAAPAYRLDVRGSGTPNTQAHISYDASDWGGYLFAGGGGGLTIGCGGAVVGGAWIAQSAFASSIAAASGGISFNVNPGPLTIGAAYTPIVVASINPAGLQLLPLAGVGVRGLGVDATGQLVVTGGGGGGMVDPTTTKGDLIVHGGSGTTRLPGSATDGFVLTYDSTIPLGVKWAAASGGSGSQTPWAQDINAAGWALNSVKAIGIGGPSQSTFALYVVSGGTDVSVMVTSTLASPLTGFRFQNAAIKRLEIGVSDSAYPSIPLRTLGLVNSVDYDLVLATGNVERMRVTQSGNVGIGTAAPGSSLSVIAPTVNTVAAANQITIGEGTNNPAYRMALGYFFNTADSVFRGVVQATNNNVGCPLLLNPLGGNVGLGLTTPTAQLSVYGTNQATGNPDVVSGAMGGTLYLKDAGAGAGNGGMITFGAAQGNAFAAIKGYLMDGSSNTAGGLVFSVRSAGTTVAALTEAMRVDYQGNVGIGVKATTAKLHVVGTSIHQGITQVVGDSAGGGATSQLVVTGATDTRKSLYVAFDTTNNWGIIQAQINTVGYNPLHLNAFGGNVGIGCGLVAPPQPLSVVHPSAGMYLGNDVTNGYVITRDTGTGCLVFYGNQSNFSGYFFDATIAGSRSRVLSLGVDGSIAMPRLGLTQPPAASYKLYIDSNGFLKVAT